MIPTLGLGEPTGVGYINGTVRDSTTLLPIGNVTVTVGANSTLTDSNGSYSLLSYDGDQTIVAVKASYDPHVAAIEVPLLDTLVYDINLTISANIYPPNGTILGYVKDSSGAAIPNATIYLGGTNKSTTSDSNGYYNMSTPEGNFFIIADKYGYSRHVANITVFRDQITWDNITLTAITLPYCETTPPLE